MNTKTVLTALACFLLLSFPIYSKTFLVGKDKLYKSPVAAVRIAQRHDTIIVNGGYYYVNKFFITKPLIIIGRNNPVLDGRNKSEVLIINSDSVEISGFTIKNVPTSYIEDWAGIRLNHADFCKITDNRLLNTFFGIYLNKSRNCIIKNNKIFGNAKNELSSGNAIHLWYSDNTIIENNIVRKQRDGIYLEFVSNSKIIGNISEDNLRYGLHFMFSDSNLYKKNIFRNNGAGVAVMFSKYIEMDDNTFSENSGSSSYGLLLKEIFDSNIIRNRIYSNTVGIYAEGITRCKIEKNEFKLNGWALKILGSCADNYVIKNNFISNTFDVSTNFSSNKNIYRRNYWGNYTGYDLDRNGIGDVPYTPIKLFSYISANSNESLILLRSLFVSLLDFAEKISPVFTPSNLKDNEPLMEPVKCWK